MRVAVLAALVLIAPAALARAGAPARDLLFTQLSGARGAAVVASAADGSNAVDLTNGAGLASDPDWSPDGAQVVFATNRDTDGTGNNELYVAAADGSSLRRLTFDTTQPKGVPRWSPDGSTIAYASGAGIWEVPAAGGTPQLLFSVGRPVRGFAWSPDGTKLAVEDQSNQVAIYDARAGRELAGVDGGLAVWSPKGDAIAWVDGSNRTAVLNLTGGLVELSDRASAWKPTWTPDGRNVIFSATTQETTLPSSRYGYPARTDLYEAPADGSAPARRLTGPFQETNVSAPAPVAPALSPNGTTLLFRTPGAVWVANADGTCAQQQPNLRSVEEGPYWRPGAAPAGGTRCVDLYAHAETLTTPVALGKEARIRIVVENHGNETAAGVIVHLTPTRYTLVSGCSRYGSGLDCSLPAALPVGGSASITVAVSSNTAGTHGFAYSVESSPADVTPQDSTGAAAADVLPCNVVGTWGVDHLVGTPGRDRICALPGADWISGGKGDDHVDAGAGNDTIYGGPGHDTILGKGGRDTIFARDGQRDWIDCGTEYDVAVVDRLDRVSHCERVLRK